MSPSLIPGLDELARRVDELAQRVDELAGGGAGDELQPNVLTFDPTTGQVGAQFSGHVAAAGVDLPAGTSTTPTNQSRVRWIRSTDGAVVATLYASNASGESRITIGAQQAATGDTVRVFAATFNQNGSFRSSVLVIDDAGNSGFLLTANDLSDLADAAAARVNLGLGTAAVVALASLLQAANNLSELTNPAAARNNLGLGTIATHPVSDFCQATGAGPIGSGGYSDAGATVVHQLGTFTGGVGSSAYTVGDLVRILKNRGVLAN